MYVLKVHGPNLSGPFDSRFDSYLIDDPAQAEIDGEWLVVRLPAYEGGQPDPARPSVRPRPPRGPMTITYAPGQWSKTVVFEKIPREA